MGTVRWLRCPMTLVYLFVILVANVTMTQSEVTHLVAHQSTSPGLFNASIEELLLVDSLETAIHRLTEAWYATRPELVNTNTSMISPLPTAVPVKGRRKQPTTHSQTEPIRRRRDIQSETSNSSNRPLTPKELEMMMMPSDDGRVYQQSDKTEITRAEKIVKHLNWESKSRLSLNCSGCTRKDHARQMQLESIKFNILHKLGFEKPPNVSAKFLPPIPLISHLLTHSQSQMMSDDPGSFDQFEQTYSKYQNMRFDQFGPIKNDEDEDEEFYVNAEKSIVFAQAPPQDRLLGHEYRAQYFNFPTSIMNSHVQRATLWVFLKPSPHRRYEPGSMLSIYQVVNSSYPNSPSLVLMRKKQIGKKLQRGGWIQIELRRIVTKWFQHPEQNLGISMRAFDGNGHQLTIIHYDDVDPESSERPFMEVKVASRSQSRRKRMAGLTCDEKSHEIRCCRYPLTVDFDQFGWEWIIAPRRYEANYCSGECPFVFLPHYPHTHLVQQATNLHGLNGPCCSPRRMSSISMLYLDHNYNIIYGILPNMVVERCGCS